MAKPKRRGGRKRGTQHLRSQTKSAGPSAQPSPDGAISTFSPEPGVAQPVLTCVKCGTAYAINLKVPEGVTIQMEAGAALQSPCPMCGMTNELRATEPTRIQVVTDGIRTILTSKKWVEELYVLRDELTKVKAGESTPEEAIQRVAEQAPAAAAVVSKIGWDRAALIALLTLIVQLLAWLAPDPFNQQQPPPVETDRLVEMVREAFEAGRQAEADTTDDHQAPRPTTQLAPSADPPAPPGAPPRC